MLTAVTGPDFSEQLAHSVERGFVTAYRFLRSRDDARDACQEAAQKAWAARERYDARRPFHAWFHVILKNHCLDVLKSRKRQELDEAMDDRPAMPDMGGPRPADEMVSSHERHRAVHVAIEQLEPDLREIIELRHFADLSYAEMAEVLDCPEGTVMSRLYRARKRLNNLLRAATPARASQEGSA